MTTSESEKYKAKAPWDYKDERDAGDHDEEEEEVVEEDLSEEDDVEEDEDEDK